ncbi:MAG: TIR domain-containing protein [Candidatus Lokiarchaeota archaeon]|nr:TIR domain-containing protein [Candidatus Lokiarchaeota archaeon]
MRKNRQIPRVFISYKSVNKSFAKKLATDLRNGGIYSWFDDWNLPPSKPLTDAMEEAISHSDVMLLLLSRESVRSIRDGEGGIAFEVHIGEGLLFHNNKLRIIGVCIEDCKPPEKLQNRIGKWIDFRDPLRYKEALAELVAWIMNPKADIGPPINSMSHSAKYQSQAGVNEISTEVRTENNEPCNECVEKLTGVGGEPCVGCRYNR